MKIAKKDSSSVYAFIDASNIIYGAKDEGWLIDQKKLFKYLKQKFNISKAFFYFGKDSKNLAQAKFLKMLELFGYTLRVKEIKRYYKRTKANCDVDLTMDMLLLQDKYFKAIVLSGDGDFLPLFEYLKIKAKKEIIIIAFSKKTSKDIKRFAKTNFIAIENQKYLLERKPKKNGEDPKLGFLPDVMNVVYKNRCQMSMRKEIFIPPQAGFLL